MSNSLATPKLEVMWPTPVCWGFNPVRRAARDGQHRAELYICVNRIPVSPSEFKFGVFISEP